MKVGETKYRLMIQVGKPKRKYGFWEFVGDVIMLILTAGVWAIWMIVRHFRNK